MTRSSSPLDFRRALEPAEVGEWTEQLVPVELDQRVELGGQRRLSVAIGLRVQRLRECNALPGAITGRLEAVASDQDRIASLGAVGIVEERFERCGVCGVDAY